MANAGAGRVAMATVPAAAESDYSLAQSKTNVSEFAADTASQANSNSKATGGQSAGSRTGTGAAADNNSNSYEDGWQRVQPGVYKKGGGKDDALPGTEFNAYSNSFSSGAYPVGPGSGAAQPQDRP